MGISISTKKHEAKSDTKLKERSPPLGMERGLHRTSSRYFKSPTTDSGYPTTASSCNDNFRKRTEVECASFSDLSLDDMILPEKKTNEYRFQSEFDHGLYSSVFGKTSFEENVNLDVMVPESKDLNVEPDGNSVKNLHIPGTVINGSLSKRNHSIKNSADALFHNEKNKLSDDYILRTSTIDRFSNKNGIHFHENESDLDRCSSQTNTNTSDPKNRPGAAHGERRRMRSESVPPTIRNVEEVSDQKILKPKTKNQICPDDELKPGEIDMLEFITKIIRDKNDNFSDSKPVLNDSQGKYGVSLTVDPASDVIKICLPGKYFIEENKTAEKQRKRKIKRHQSMYTKSWR